jgi:predicted O-linked N-acetylglucosamine transferase (SPINDLY family)
MLLNYVPSLDQQAIRIEHERWAAAHAAKWVASQAPNPDPHPSPPPEYREREIGAPPVFSGTSKAPDVPLRVGYVSADFWQHPVSYFIEPVLAGHDRRKVIPYVYSDVAHPDATTLRLRNLVHDWVDTRGMSDDSLAEQIRGDGIDILVDLSGHTLGNRLLTFARRPAPIQISWLGYPNTTGLPGDVIQYRLTDAICDPPGQTETFHTESLIRLPRTFLCYRTPAEAAELRSQSRSNEPVTFGSFNGLPKITPQVVVAWSRILLKSPGSRLLLKCKGLGEAAVRGRMMGEFAKHGIGRSRLEILPPDAVLRDHLAHYQQTDIALDTFPYNGLPI